MKTYTNSADTLGGNMLHCYKDEIEWIIAESPEDASKIQASNIGEEASSPDQFELIPEDSTLTIHSDEGEFPEGETPSTKTIAEWIAWNGRGVLCSAEW